MAAQAPCPPPTSGSSPDRMRTWLDPLYKVLGALGALFILVTLLIEVANIVGLTVGLSMAGVDAYAGYTLAAGSFLAMAAALRHGDHIRVTLIIQRLSGRPRWWLEVFCLAVATFLSGYFAWFAGRLVWGSYVFNDVSQNIDATPLWLPQLSMAIGLGALFLAFLEELIQTLRTRQVVTPSRSGHIE
jgi:TRAP-type C4-dicarboxylate transport system permease small subunit